MSASLKIFMVLIFSSQFLFAQHVVGQYIVPTDDAALTEASQFNLEKVAVSDFNGLTTVSFEVPAELVGEPLPVKYFGSLVDGAGTLHGQNIGYETPIKNEIHCSTVVSTLASATASATASQLICNVDYKGLTIDSKKAEAILIDRHSADQDLLAKKILIQKKFSTDPVGVVEIKLGL